VAGRAAGFLSVRHVVNQSNTSNAVECACRGRAQGAVRQMLSCRVVVAGADNQNEAGQVVVAGVDNQNANEQAVDGCAVAGLGEKNRAVSS